MSSPRAATDARILGLPGGSRILEARNAARRLIEMLPGRSQVRGGAVDGWDDLSRRGRIEHLLMTEHIVDDDEFFRRRFHGEQLHLSRQASTEVLSRAAVIWDLGIAALGAPRLSAMGFALALTQRGPERIASARFLVNGQREIDLGVLDGVREALQHPPLHPDAAGLPQGFDRTFDGDLLFLTSNPARAQLAARERRRYSAVLVAEERRMALLLPGRRGDWQRVEASISAAVPP